MCSVVKCVARPSLCHAPTLDALEHDQSRPQTSVICHNSARTRPARACRPTVVGLSRCGVAPSRLNHAHARLPRVQEVVQPRPVDSPQRLQHALAAHGGQLGQRGHAVQRLRAGGVSLLHAARHARAESRGNAGRTARKFPPSMPGSERRMSCGSMANGSADSSRSVPTTMACVRARAPAGQEARQAGRQACNVARPCACSPDPCRARA